MPERKTTHADDNDSGEATTNTETTDSCGMSTMTADDRDHVTLSVTVDTSGMDAREKEALERLATLYEECFMEVYEKNRDYSWSFLTAGSKLAASDATPFEHPSRSQAYGLLTRTGDKRERLIENVYGDGDASVSDDPSTTAAEAANYYMFLSFVLANPDLASSFLEA